MDIYILNIYQCGNGRCKFMYLYNNKGISSKGYKYNILKNITLLVELLLHIYKERNPGNKQNGRKI